MRNASVYENENLFINKFLKEENQKTLISDKMLETYAKCSEISTDTFKEKAVSAVRIAISPFVLAIAGATYCLERNKKRETLSYIMKIPKDNIAFSAGDFADKDGNPKVIVGCADELNVKDVKKESLENLKLIVKDLHMESLSENFEVLDNLEIIGGNLYLSDKNIEEYISGGVLPKLKKIGGKTFVNSRECKD